MADSVGFHAHRRYPEGSRLDRIVTGAGAHDVRCLIQFTLVAPGQAVSALRVSTAMSSAWRQKRPFGGHNFADPSCPTPASVRLLRRKWKPLPIDFRSEFFYDAGDGRFYDEEGRQVTGAQILDYVYDYHYRTTRLRFLVKWTALQAVRAIIQKVVWRGQDLCLWVLERGYEITTDVPPGYGIFHPYAFADFQRPAPSGPSHFFGLQSSRLSLFPNLLVLLACCGFTYWKLREVGIVRAIYRNPILTTIVLLFLYLLIDKTVPHTLQALVVGLSRLRRRVLFLTRPVRA